MANVSIENIRILFDQISSLSFFSRIFGWNRILHQNGAAYAEFQELSKRIPGLIQKYSEQKNIIASLQHDIEYHKSDIVKISSELDFQKKIVNSYQGQIQDKEREIATLKESERQYTTRLSEQGFTINKCEITIEQLQQESLNKENELGTLRESS